VFGGAAVAVTKLTEARVRKLPLGSGIWRDTEVKGLMVVCHRTTRTYAVQGDVRRSGRLVRTVRVKIDRCDRIGLQRARARAKALMSQIQSGVDPTAGPEETGVTLSKALERYVEDRRLRPATVANYRYHVDHYLRRWRNRAIADITRQNVRDLYDDLRRRSGQTTASAVMRTLRAVVNDARRADETIRDNPVAAIRVPPPGRREPAPLDLVAWWAKTAELSPVRRDLHRAMLFTGARRLSLLLCERADADLDEGVLTLRHMKGSGPMLLPLSRFLTEMLKARLEEDVPMGSRWLWPSPTSRSGHVEEPKEPGLPSPHEYRHHYRTLAIAAGVPYAESALLLGQRLPGASGGYVHASHLVEHLRGYQEAVSEFMVSGTKPDAVDSEC
jgi:hypothetical protein